MSVCFERRSDKDSGNKLKCKLFGVLHHVEYKQLQTFRRKAVPTIRHEATFQKTWIVGTTALIKLNIANGTFSLLMGLKSSSLQWNWFYINILSNVVHYLKYYVELRAMFWELATPILGWLVLIKLIFVFPIILFSLVYLRQWTMPKMVVVQ